jgi:hypothetical protein
MPRKAAAFFAPSFKLVLFLLAMALFSLQKDAETRKKSRAFNLTMGFSSAIIIESARRVKFCGA